MGWADYLPGSLSIEKGEAESRRFGISVVNLRCGDDIGGGLNIAKLLGDVNFDLAVVRFPSSNPALGGQLRRDNWGLVVTDPTVYWGAEISGVRRMPVEAVFEPASSGDLDEVGDVIKSAFRNYRSHWHYNPLTSGINMVDAYIEWLKNVVARHEEGAYLLRSLSDRRPMGMALLEFCGSFVEVLLAGVSAGLQGQGNYAMIVAGIEDVARERGVEKVVISTQASNINVQKAWARYGWLPLKTLQTVHVVRENP